MLTFKEFKNTIFYTRTKLIIPIPKRISIEKTKFMVKGKYSFEKQDEFLRKLYENIKNKLK